MKIRVPEYFTSFTCIADKCQDSCCIGWGIDVDDITAEKYAALKCEIGVEIVKKTKHGCFDTDKNGRCAFLDDKGLCRIISALGEGYLCDICREHPRYYGVGYDGIEGGLGLCCEEAARIILSIDKKPEFVTVEKDIRYDSEDEHESCTDSMREYLYEVIYSSNVDTLPCYFMEYAKFADDACFDLASGITDNIAPIPKITPIPCREKVTKLLKSAIETFGECELLDDCYGKRLSEVRDIDYENLTTMIRDNEKAFRNLLFYFTHRHVRECIDDMTFGQRILFATSASLTVILLAHGYKCDDRLVRSAVDFSKNIEYSTDNQCLIFDALSENL